MRFAGAPGIDCAGAAILTSGAAHHTTANMEATPHIETTRGIECPQCFGSTGVARTEHFDGWTRRVRLCKNLTCLHAFVAEERLFEMVHAGTAD